MKLVWYDFGQSHSPIEDANAKLVDVDRRLATADSSMEFDAYFAFGHNMLRLCLDFGSPHHL